MCNKKENSEGKANCINLLATIQHKEVNLQTERVNIPGQAFRTLVTYRNITQLHVRLVKMDKKTRTSLGNDTWGDGYWKKLIGLPVLKTFTQSLPDTKDYQQHRIEIKADGLPVGEYAFLVSANKEFGFTNNPLAIQQFYVSNLAYINKDKDYFVLDRETGAPIARAAVQVWYRNYDYNASKEVERQGENMFTDKNGYFTLYPPKTNSNNYFRIEISTKEDRLSLDEFQYNYQRGETPPATSSNQSFLFTDRSIYRPGQIIYFKGIVLNRREGPIKMQCWPISLPPWH
ncbi:hypothetical protein [Paraflavitalea speifideaquila]|uniref:hypothetical protein n=1 Tax=Paraflavitalea speifideaquila TaxID=3076558 RepID=UPI0028E60B44|nr:hypothetical protein [Paraflavitalea speifideiaquila]